ncbi:MAG: type II toxin-antitoxin system HigB family toxin [Legionellales bacterium]|nr:type II toxin-antitoxin system HigB family toxin [Legionellales bacterium]
MHIITKKRIVEAKDLFPACKPALDGWFKIIKDNKFKSFSELKKVFNTVDKVGHLYVFNIEGNKLRLIASIHFNRQKLYIRNIFSHKEYDKGDWRK